MTISKLNCINIFDRLILSIPFQNSPSIKKLYIANFFKDTILGINQQIVSSIFVYNTANKKRNNLKIKARNKSNKIYITNVSYVF